MKYSDKVKLEEAIKTILMADEEQIENLHCDFVKKEAKKIRAMADEQ
jgi:hypothetical protein